MNTQAPPPPPPGPGVHPPFPAPPVEGRGRRIGLGFGIGGGVVLLVCGGGLAAVIGLGTSLSGSLGERADAAVTDYMDAVQAREFGRAYGLLCAEARAGESSTAYAQRMALTEKVTAYQVGDLDMTTLHVPVDVTYADGDTAHLSARLGQDESTGEFEVCDLGE
ncbi:hypothetical protein [Actinoplanes sp. NPDC051851]|uniref:hypothetical protein n=1 Tax=Actinoplanes sp. NPDC051851 TaxID=3154753 RepID=UPI00341CBCE6